MGTDNLFRKRRGIKKRRKENIRERAPYRYLIVCEGGKTEPNYFEGIRKMLDEKHKDKIDVKVRIELDIEGTGRNTEDLLNYAKKISSLSEILYGHVWLIFDRDDSTCEQFNNTITKAQNADMEVGWSNEAIELWFLLHFEYLDSAIHRYKYIDKLNHYFKKHGIGKGKYEKNLDNIFEILSEYGDINQAIRNAEKLREFYREQEVDNEFYMNPCTTVDQLVGELLGYLNNSYY